MASKARDYTVPTKKKLFALCGNRCANPECDRPIVARDGITIAGKICHIEAASPDGPRYNAAMTDAQRAHYDNLILLCDECHSIIDNKDNEGKYSVELLTSWKKNHESKCLHERLRNPSLLYKVINAIASANLEDDSVGPKIAPFDISDKIQYNNIKRNRCLIEEYAGYNGKIGSIYAELEKAGSFKKEKLLSNIRTIYLKVKGTYVLDSTDYLTIIQEKADDIMDDVEGQLLTLVEGSGLSGEDMAFGVSVIMVDAFMRCKILEEPKT